MSEAVTVPSLMMMTSLVSEESLAMDTHTDTILIYFPYATISLLNMHFSKVGFLFSGFEFF